MPHLECISDVSVSIVGIDFKQFGHHPRIGHAQVNFRKVFQVFPSLSARKLATAEYTPPPATAKLLTEQPNVADVACAGFSRQEAPGHLNPAGTFANTLPTLTKAPHCPTTSRHDYPMD